MSYATVLLGERFGCLPWEVEQAPTDRVLYYFGVLSAEGETKALLEGLSREEPLILDEG